MNEKDTAKSIFAWLRKEYDLHWHDDVGFEQEFETFFEEWKEYHKNS